MNGKIWLRRVVAIAIASLVIGLSIPATADDEVDIHTLCSKFPLKDQLVQLTGINAVEPAANR